MEWFFEEMRGEIAGHAAGEKHEGMSFRNHE